MDKPLKSFILGVTTIAEPNYVLVKERGSNARKSVEPDDKRQAQYCTGLMAAVKRLEKEGTKALRHEGTKGNRGETTARIGKGHLSKTHQKDSIERIELPPIVPSPGSPQILHTPRGTGG